MALITSKSKKFKFDSSRTFCCNPDPDLPTRFILRYWLMTSSGSFIVDASFRIIFIFLGFLSHIELLFHGDSPKSECIFLRGIPFFRNESLSWTIP